MLQSYEIQETQKVWEDEHVRFSCDAEESIARAIWKPATENMNNEEYMQVFTRIAELITQENIKGWLGDTREFAKAVTPDLQEWFNTEVLPGLMEGGLEKMAMLAPQEFIANLSVEQSVDEIMMQNGGKFTIQYFDDLDKAEAWLKE